VSSDEEVKGEVGKAPAPGNGENAGSIPRAVSVGEAQGKQPGECSGSVGGVGKPPPPPAWVGGKKGDLG
jgi:hypothetical protein